MIYAIFACILISHSGSGNCKMLPFGPYQSAADCKADMLATFGPGVYVKGQLIPNTARIGSPTLPITGVTWSGEWYECDGKPTWETAE